MTDLSTHQTTREVELIKRSLILLREGADRIARELDTREGGGPRGADFRELGRSLAKLLEAAGQEPLESIREAAHDHLIALYRWIRQAMETIPEPGAENPEGETLAGLREAASFLGPQPRIGPGGMAVFITVSSAERELWTPARVKDSLRRRGIVYGIDEEAIQQLFDENRYDREICVARGKEPTLGRPARIEKGLNLIGSPGIPLGAEGGKTDPKTQYFFLPVEKGQAVFMKTPAAEGEAGMDVFGAKVPGLPGPDADLPTLRNCAVDPDRTGVFSLVEGFAYLEAGQIVLLPAEMIRGNVNANSGDIKSAVSVYVHGNVLSDFSVESGEDIAVRGMIERAVIRAQGTVFCRGGVYGKEKAVIQSGKHVLTTYVQGARIQAGGDLVVRGPIIESEVSARRILSEGPNGQIVGGKLEAWEDICAAEIGSETGVATELFLGNELPGLRETVEKLREELCVKEQEINYLRQTAPRGDEQEETGTRTREENPRPIENAPPNVDKEREILLKKLEKATRDLAYSEACARMVRARQAIHAGTVIHILGQTLTVMESLGPSTILYANGNWVTLPFQERAFEDQEGEGMA
ncbi:MAG: DUF342 domain-containing protein [bacterium]